jgi:hypothetical protein
MAADLVGDVWNTMDFEERKISFFPKKLSLSRVPLDFVRGKRKGEVS